MSAKQHNDIPPAPDAEMPGDVTDQLERMVKAAKEMFDISQHVARIEKEIEEMTRTEQQAD